MREVPERFFQRHYLAFLWFLDVGVPGGILRHSLDSGRRGIGLPMFRRAATNRCDALRSGCTRVDFSESLRASVRRDCDSLCEKPGGIFRVVGQDDASSGATDAEQRFHHHSIALHPFFAAASIIAYSPDTWYAANGRSKCCRAAAITSRYGIAGLTMIMSAPSSTSASISRMASRRFAPSIW